ncbi:DNA-3-methyladenine glycosylase I [Acetobacter cibinongensis]|uniref:DNA-3-methyladenine glycosylase I n=1 Tax=Acetobacter cibinongensis TaxID=146475 RepID=A0A0D6N2R5_9PROT|nr:DNA-3-methyladenine glycosylase I [Acetobacter cibinongensis]GAN59863.1 DNA-3-methyladenine glycosylase I [Acetobacter cibinongensis]GBQ14693.1 DNA-3-methyladenine glycosylase I [Acetobacter cibinongensis NRIC 0482]GEL59386.1 DNA-3-methyladenine glycosylase I [Acetobacter cibinongensis]
MNHEPFSPDLPRCTWAQTNPLLRAYHDEEWGVPVKESQQLWAMLMLEGFQAGLSWLTVLKRRDGFLRAFAGFDPAAVAQFDQQDVERLMADPGIIRARAKIEATIGNARAYLAMQANGEDFATFAWGLVPDAPLCNVTGQVLAQSPESQALSKALKKRGFKFVGPVIVYAWMQAVGMVDDHDPQCFCYHTRRLKS